MNNQVPKAHQNRPKPDQLKSRPKDSVRVPFSQDEKKRLDALALLFDKPVDLIVQRATRQMLQLCQDAPENLNLLVGGEGFASVRLIDALQQ